MLVKVYCQPTVIFQNFGLLFIIILYLFCDLAYFQNCFKNISSQGSGGDPRDVMFSFILISFPFIIDASVKFDKSHYLTTEKAKNVSVRVVLTGNITVPVTAR